MNPRGEPVLARERTGWVSERRIHREMHISECHFSRCGRLVFCLILSFFFSGIAFGHDFTAVLYSHETQGGFTNIWRVSSDVLAKAPIWKAGGEPPLSPGKAVAIAKAHIIAAGGNKDLWVADMALNPVFPGSKEYEGVYYYNICFGGGSCVGHFQRCILLMDGTIIEPEWEGSKPTIITPGDYDE
jgi:hypothetical protein